MTADEPGLISGNPVYRIIWAPAPAAADGPAADSPGAISGNAPRVAPDVPVQACGDSVATLRLGDQATGSTCANGGPEAPIGPPPGAPADGAAAHGAAHGAAAVLTRPALRLVDPGPPPAEPFAAPG